MFEMLAGSSPFSKPNEPNMEMFKRIILVKYTFPMFMDRYGEDLIKKLLVRRVANRLGIQRKGFLDVRNHEFFLRNGIDSRMLLKKDIRAPWVPSFKDPMDSHYFQDFSKIEREPAPGPPLSSQEQALFEDF